MYSVKVLRWETRFLFLILLHVCALSWTPFIMRKDGFIAVRLKLNISLPSPLAFTLQSYSAPLTCKARLRCF